ncbi:MAG: AAA family ATPase [Chloroflexi bacterium]|nr:AAA family ATPase [Chloroflexota bacterium]
MAHENDPERALRAALEMMDALEQFNVERGTDLGLHFGINTGLVVAGSLGTRDRQEYSVLGDAVNLAARLEGASERGEIFVGPDTYRHAAPLFEFEALEPMRVKGKAELIQVYKLADVKIQPGQLRGLAGLESPMVGRDVELSALLETSQAVRDGQGRVALIIGEPGLGKSRLVAEWRTAVGELGLGRSLSAQWVKGRCLSYGQGLAYHLLIDLLRSLIGVPAAASKVETRTALLAFTNDLFGDAMLDVYPYLGHLLSLHLEGEAQERVRLLDPQALQAQYLTALRRLLQTLADQSPLTLILEDIHWADPSSTELLIKLLPLTAETLILFCFVTRHYHDAPGWKLVTFAREQMSDDLTELTLNTLSDTDSRQLISNLLEIEGLPEHIRTLILKKAEGNPFFVEEVIRMLIDRGGIVQEGDHWAAQQAIETMDIPDNLQGLLLARIDRLPDNVKHTLRVAAVIGRQFSVKVLEQVQGSV